MLNFLIARLLSAAIVVFGVVCMVFMLIHFIPGDPVEVMLGESARAADRQALTEALGLNQPIHVQLADYLHGLASFDLGQSLHSKRPITELLAERIPATAWLAMVGLGIAVLLAFPLGILAALKKDGPADMGAMVFSLLGVSIPNFWLGPILIMVFSLWLGWLPVSGIESPGSIILPAVTLGTAMAAILSRMVRSSLLEVLSEDHIRTARAKGLPERVIILRHALANAMLPIITLLGLQLGVLLGGAVITEAVFSWPGIGSLIIESIQKRDYPVVQACVLLISVSYVVINTLTDLVYAVVDPRIRLGDS